MASAVPDPTRNRSGVRGASATRGEHEMFHARRDACIQQVHGVGDIVTEVLAGVNHAGGNERARRKMHHGVGSQALEALLHHGTVGQVALDKLRALVDRLSVSIR